MGKHQTHIDEEIRLPEDVLQVAVLILEDEEYQGPNREESAGFNKDGDA